LALLDKTKFGYSASKMPFGIHYSWVIVAVLAIVQVFGSSVHDCRRNGAPADRPWRRFPLGYRRAQHEHYEDHRRISNLMFSGKSQLISQTYWISSGGLSGRCFWRFWVH